MIRSVLVVGEHGRIVFSKEYNPSSSEGLNNRGVGALVSVVHSIIPLLTGSSIRKMKVADEFLLIQAKDGLVFVLSSDEEITTECEKKLDFVIAKFTAQYQGIIPYLDENTDLQVFNDFSSTLNESDMFP